MHHRQSRIVEVRDLNRQHFWNIHVSPWTSHPVTSQDKIRAFLKAKDRSKRYVTLQVTDLTQMVHTSSRMKSNAVSADIYHQIVKTISDYAIFMLDPQGYVLTWNIGAERLMLYTETEVKGLHFSIFFRPEDCLEGEPHDELTHALEGRGNQIQGWRVRKDGTLFLASISIQPIYSDDKRHIGFVKVTRDMTHHKKAELAIIDAHEQAADLKQNFLATASHELRSPLTSLLVALYYLYSTKLTEEQKDAIDSMRFAGETLSRIVDNLLDYSKLEARAVKLASSNIVIRDTLKALVKEYQKRSSVPIYLKVSPDVPAVVVADLARLQQVLSNLIDNAVKFTKKGHIKIVVHVRRKSSITDTHTTRTSLLVRVEDTGIGLTSEQIDRLFIPFSQADDTISEEYGGTGLGLSICKQCIELMNGRIWVESKKGQGSTFIFTMDLVIGQSEKETLSASASHSSSLSEPAMLPNVPIQIIVVDDNDIIRKMVGKLLGMRGFSPILFSDGLDVVAFFEELARQSSNSQKYMVLMDIEMPGLNGLDATKQIHALPKFANVPIIGVTANAMRGDRQICLDAGMVGYISKPFKVDQLLSRIDEISIQLAKQQTV